MREHQQTGGSPAPVSDEGALGRGGINPGILVSVVMPIRNESRTIAQSLEAVLGQQGLKGPIEVIVADGRSEDGTRAIVLGMQARCPNLVLVDNVAGIVATGLNAAIRRASGSIVVRVDGHTIIGPDYVAQCVAALARSGADNVGGPMRAQGEGLFGAAVALATSSPFGVGGARFHYSEKEEWVDTVYLGAWRKEAFARFGLFDETMVRNQDDEFNYRTRARGGRILLSPRIRSLYWVRSTPFALARQYCQYGYWKVHVMQRHRRQMRVSHFVPPALVAAFLVALGGSCLASRGRIALVLLTGLYGGVNLAASLWTVLQRRAWRLLPVLPVAYAILHLAYGLGFLAGTPGIFFRSGGKGQEGM